MNGITELITEMRRCFSTSSQSEFAWQPHQFFVGVV
jgi:hypothetical protein